MCAPCSARSWGQHSGDQAVADADRLALVERVGSLPKVVLRRVDDGLRLVLDLGATAA